MRRIVIAAVAMAVMSSLGVTAAHAGTPTSEPGAAAKEYCAVLVGKPTAKDAVSPVLGQACSTASPEEARTLMEADANANSRAAGGPVALSSDLLMTAWEDSYYNGSSTNFYGSAGPCDSSGYSLHLDTGWFSWGDRISSAAGTAQCRIARFHTQSATYSLAFRLPTPGLGSTLNDNVDLVQIWNG